VAADDAGHAVRVRISGRVQNVWYRYWTTKEARARGLRGWVRNRLDGTVEALFIGEATAVAAMIEACRDGPSDARVAEVAEAPDTDDGSDGFREVRTA
jgi:acylphosphatase